MKLKYCFLIYIIILTTSLYAQEDLQKKFFEEQEKIFQEFIQQENSHWQDFVNLESKQWKDFVDSVEKKWGKKAVFSGKKNWTRYGNKLESRVNTDFEKGEITIEAFAKKDKTIAELKKKTENIIKEVLEEKANLTDDKPILEDQLAVEVKPEKIPEKYIEVKPDTLPDGTDINLIIIKIPFRKDHLKQRVEKVLPYVKEYSKKYNLDPKLVLAIIHTESAFNPKARSTFKRSNGKNGHAYGLMQLVPYSGGLEANRHLGNSGKPDIETLYDREKNILLGTTYLHLLKYKHFKPVKNGEKSNYLIICAYNTGPGNVARAIINSKNVSSACSKVNKMKEKELYLNLINKLPYKETRDYLERVNKRILLY